MDLAHLSGDQRASIARTLEAFMVRADQAAVRVGTFLKRWQQRAKIRPKLAWPDSRCHCTVMTEFRWTTLLRRVLSSHHPQAAAGHRMNCRE
jgi:hypothetical protein